nr:MAG TPA: Head Tail Connector Protein [Caudoviricetes sp.]
MTYADYTYYSGTYMGTVSEKDFPRLAVRASSFLDYYTQNRAKDHAELDAVKMCCCALVDKYAVIDAAQALATKRLTDASAADAEIKSETVGGYSRTLATGGESAISAQSATDGARKLLADTCNEYLAHTGLLYRGGCRCTHPTL